MKTGLEITAHLLDLLLKIKDTHLLARPFEDTYTEEKIWSKVTFEHQYEDSFSHHKFYYDRKELLLAMMHDNLAMHYNHLAETLNHFEATLAPSLSPGPPSVSFWQEIATHQEQVARVIRTMLDNPQLERVTPWRYSPEPLREPWYQILDNHLQGLEADIKRGLRNYRIMRSIPADIRQEEHKQRPWMRSLPPVWRLWDFNRRAFRQRAEVVWENGHFLIGRREGPFRIELYWVRRFFVEIWYRESEQSLELVHGFTKQHNLQLYEAAENLLWYPEGFKMKGMGNLEKISKSFNQPNPSY